MAEISQDKAPLMENNPETQELDQVLANMDPEFAKNLETIQSVHPNTEIHIETEKIEVDESGEIIEPVVAKKPSGIKARINVIKQAILLRSARIADRIWFFLKTVPKDIAIATFKGVTIAVKAVVGAISKIIKGFFAFSRAQKLAAVGVLALAITLLMVIKANLKGDWLPALNEPILTSFEPRADSVTEFDVKEKMISFARAFPQDPEMFLFDKLKVNLRRNSSHSNPMGAFEIFAQVDSHETAVELQTRQVALHDAIQRVFEGQQYEELVSDLGKNRMKGLIKSEINHELTQGWVVDIHFKTFILKP
jgi:flagellar basal body-associated protein FliL